jgi:ABC-type transport system involved in multi-copper enzyme maturation permease subunit
LSGDPPRSRLDLSSLAVLAAIPLLLLAVALWAFNRRDVGV